MLTDLSENFRVAKSNQLSWKRPRFLDLLERTATLLDAKLDWDENAGENWATFHTDRTVALVSIAVPFALVAASFDHKLEALCSTFGVTKIRVSDFDHKNYTLAPNAIFEIFRISETEIDRHPGKPICVNDIWFHTI